MPVIWVFIYRELKIMNISDLKQKRGVIADKMVDMTKSIDAENWSDENTIAFDALSNDLDNIELSINRAEKAENAQEKSNLVENLERPVVGIESILNTRFGTQNYENNFNEFIKSGGQVRNDLSVGVDAKGGFTVSESWEKSLDRYLYDNVVMRQVSTVRKYSTDTHIPQTIGGGVAARLGEGAAYPTNDLTVQEKIIRSLKIGNIVLVSEELLQDSMYNIQSEISEEYGSVFGAQEETDFTTGTGVGVNPSGFLTTAQNGLVAASLNSITLDELIDLQHSVRDVYARKGVFMFNRLTAASLRKLKATDGTPLWQPNIQAGQPNTFMGSAYYINEKMPNMTTGLKPIAFGDFTQYVIGDRLGIQLQILREKYADIGKVGFKFTARNDGILKRTEAIKTITMF